MQVSLYSHQAPVPHNLKLKIFFSAMINPFKVSEFYDITNSKTIILRLILEVLCFMSGWV